MFKMIKIIAFAAASLGLSSATASSASLHDSFASGTIFTYDIEGSFSGGELGDVDFDFTLKGDFTSSIPSRFSDITINKLTSSVVAGDPIPLSSALTFVYTKSLSSDVLTISPSPSNNLSASYGTNFVRMQFLNFSTAPVLSDLLDSAAPSLTYGTPTMNRFSVTLSDVVIPAVVPLPATLPMLITGLLAGLFCARQRKA